MIESIQISNIATFGVTPEELSGLSQFNFIYGANGSGKTTISRIIANESALDSCKIQWNNDFVDRFCSSLISRR